MFIFAFALGFYILLHKDDGEQDDEYPFFNYLGLTVVKTFTMFVGELEFADLPIETPVGYVFFMAFIFLIVVVMMNLLNGLAVSDTGVIRNEAEINFYACQVSFQVLCRCIKPPVSESTHYVPQCSFDNRSSKGRLKVILTDTKGNISRRKR